MICFKSSDIRKPVYEHLYLNNNPSDRIPPSSFKIGQRSLDKQRDDDNRGLFTEVYDSTLDEELPSVRSTSHSTEKNIYHFSKNKPTVATDHLFAFEYKEEENESKNNDGQNQIKVVQPYYIGRNSASNHEYIQHPSDVSEQQKKQKPNHNYDSYNGGSTKRRDTNGINGNGKQPYSSSSSSTISHNQNHNQQPPYTEEKAKENTRPSRPTIREDWEQLPEFVEYCLTPTKYYCRYLTPTKDRRKKMVNELKKAKNQNESSSQDDGVDSWNNNSELSNNTDDNKNKVLTNMNISHTKHQNELKSPPVTVNGSLQEYKQYRIKSGDLSFTQKPIISDEDKEKNLYNYIPANTEMQLTFKAIVQGPGKSLVHERALNGITQYKHDQNSLQKFTSDNNWRLKTNDKTHADHSPRIRPIDESIIVNNNNQQQQQRKEEPIINIQETKNNDYMPNVHRKSTNSTLIGFKKPADDMPHRTQLNNERIDQQKTKNNESPHSSTNRKFSFPLSSPFTPQNAVTSPNAYETIEPVDETNDQKKSSFINKTDDHFRFRPDSSQPAPAFVDSEYNFNRSQLSDRVSLSSLKQADREIEESDQEEDNTSECQSFGHAPMNNSVLPTNRSNQRFEQDDAENYYAEPDLPSQTSNAAAKSTEIFPIFDKATTTMKNQPPVEAVGNNSLSINDRSPYSYMEVTDDVNANDYAQNERQKNIYEQENQSSDVLNSSYYEHGYQIHTNQNPTEPRIPVSSPPLSTHVTSSAKDYEISIKSNTDSMSTSVDKERPETQSWSYPPFSPTQQPPAPYQQQPSFGQKSFAPSHTGSSNSKTPKKKSFFGASYPKTFPIQTKILKIHNVDSFKTISQESSLEDIITEESDPFRYRGRNTPGIKLRRPLDSDSEESDMSSKRPLVFETPELVNKNVQTTEKLLRNVATMYQPVTRDVGTAPPSFPRSTSTQTTLPQHFNNSIQEQYPPHIARCRPVSYSDNRNNEPPPSRRRRSSDDYEHSSPQTSMCHDKCSYVPNGYDQPCQNDQEKDYPYRPSEIIKSRPDVGYSPKIDSEKTTLSIGTDTGTDRLKENRGVQNETKPQKNASTMSDNELSTTTLKQNKGNTKIDSEKTTLSIGTDTGMDRLKENRSVQNETKPQKNASTMSDNELSTTTLKRNKGNKKISISKRNIGVDTTSLAQQYWIPVASTYRSKLPTECIEKQKPYSEQAANNDGLKKPHSEKDQLKTIDMNNSIRDKDPKLLLSERKSISFENSRYDDDGDDKQPQQPTYYPPSVKNLDLKQADMSLLDNNESLLNIGSINYISDPIMDEYADQFSTKSNNGNSNRIKFDETNKRNTLMMPVLNMSRLYLVEKQQLRKKDFSLPRQMSQGHNERLFFHNKNNDNREKSSIPLQKGQQPRRPSQSNGNFFLSKKPSMTTADSSFMDDNIYSKIDT
ncbi:unnamed protein product [Didymodactylos carnosus]|uniref:Uncharacterized protein n=1 Tax=Didymodactylos carnosus TaxID=1234261 RepID=A0A8S2ITK2_9BILA|nr:unnamed protein product [Didymodactylos carnosus]CAF3772608.1 unnamed protein product [Didymodactylos carnosus]